MEIQENVSMKTLTTFRTGGPARFLLTLENKDEIEKAVAFSEEQKLPLLPLGHGSNILPPDRGLNAILVRYAPARIVAAVSGSTVRVSAEAGCVWDALVAEAVKNDWWGIENLSAIPGTVGAAVVQNIGAYGAVLSDTLLEVSAYDFREKRWIVFKNVDCNFGYRTSVFKQNPDRYLITDVVLGLSLYGAPNLVYRDLEKYFEKHPVTPTLPRVREAVISIRKGKFPDLAEFGTAGSFFLNPVFTEESVKEIRKKYPDMPVYPLPEGGVKVPLAWIFDQVLKAKGRRVGGAFVWDKQPLVIAADVDARTSDVVALAESIIEDFFKETGIKISSEVRLFEENSFS